MIPPTLADYAERVTDATLTDFLERLRTRPGLQTQEYTGLILEAAADTLNRKPFSVFREYQDLTGVRNPELAERLWKISFPVGVLDIKPPVEKCVIIDFPVNRAGKSKKVVALG